MLSRAKNAKGLIRRNRSKVLVAGMSSALGPERRGFKVRKFGWRPFTTVSWMWAALLIALALAVVVLVIFGVGERGTAIALRATARWSFLLFWLAYAGSAIAWLCRPHLGGLARHGRELGLAFASAQLIHVGLVLWIIHIAKGSVGAMLFFWVGMLCTYLLALFSVPRLRDALEHASLADIPHDCARIHSPRLRSRFYHAARGRARRAELSAICTHAR